MTDTVVARLPIPIWERIASHLPRTDLAALSLTCTRLRNTAQSILFATLTCTGIPFNVRPTKKQKAPWLAYTVRLRALAAAPHLCAHVKSINLVDWSAGHPEPLVWEAGKAVFGLVRALPALHTATCTRVLFKSETFAAVAGASTLRRLGLHGCTFSSDGSRYALERVKVIAPPDITDFAATSFAEAALSLLDAHRLRELVLDAPPAPLLAILTELADGPRMEALEHLELTVTQTEAILAQLPRFLQNCPVLVDPVLKQPVLREVVEEDLSRYLGGACGYGPVGIELLGTY